MIQKTVGKTLIIAGTTIVTIPFASAAFVLLGVLSVCWLKDQTILIGLSLLNSGESI